MSSRRKSAVRCNVLLRRSLQECVLTAAGDPDANGFLIRHHLSGRISNERAIAAHLRRDFRPQSTYLPLWTGFTSTIFVTVTTTIPHNRESLWRHVIGQPLPRPLNGTPAFSASANTTAIPPAGRSEKSKKFLCGNYFATKIMTPRPRHGVSRALVPHVGEEF